MGSLSLGAGSLGMGGEWVGCTGGPGEVAARRDVDVSYRVCTLAVQQLLTWMSLPPPPGDTGPCLCMSQLGVLLVLSEWGVREAARHPTVPGTAPSTNIQIYPIPISMVPM